MFHQFTSANKYPMKRYCRNILSEIRLNNYIQLFSEQNRTEVISFLYDTLPYDTLLCCSYGGHRRRIIYLRILYARPFSLPYKM